MQPKKIATADYASFEEAKADMRKSMPPVLYKFRDWSEINHKVSLTVPSIWFSHPKSLNDPYDIRVPEKVDYGDINSTAFSEKIKEVIRAIHPEFSIGSRDYNTACSNLLDVIKQDPEKWFQDNQKAIRESNLFDNIGLFSLSSNELSETLWGYYGNSGKGFCIGYDPVKIFEAHKCSFSKVYYSDEAIQKNLLESNEEFDSFWNFFRKQKRWEGEEEFRFVTMFISKNSDREVKLPLDAIKEVVLGHSISKANREQIIKVLKDKYHSNVSLYIIEPQVSSFGFKKVVINY